MVYVVEHSSVIDSNSQPPKTQTHSQTVVMCGLTTKNRAVLRKSQSMQCNIYFPHYAVIQQPSEMKTIATASVALTMGSLSHFDISLKATHGQTDPVLGILLLK